MTAAPARCALPDRFLHRSDAVRIKAGERLIKQNRAWLVQIGAADRHLLPHAARELLSQRITLGRQFELIQQRQRVGFKVFHRHRRRR